MFFAFSLLLNTSHGLKIFCLRYTCERFSHRLFLIVLLLGGDCEVSEFNSVRTYAMPYRCSLKPIFGPQACSSCRGIINRETKPLHLPQRGVSPTVPDLLRVRFLFNSHSLLRPAGSLQACPPKQRREAEHQVAASHRFLPVRV